MGLRAEVYRTARLGDCSNGGLSSRVDTVTIVNAEGPFKPDEHAPAVLLQKGPMGTVNAVPVTAFGEGWALDRPGGGVGPMMGGAYIATSDSRFREKVDNLLDGSGFYGAVALHDRFETAAQYAAMGD